MGEKDRLDQNLMVGVSRRDGSALSSLYDRHAGVLLALALRVLATRSEAEELLGDVFWEVWRRPDRYDPSRGTVLAYLITITRSRSIDRLRAGVARARRVVADADLDERAGTDTAPTPLEEAVMTERRDRVREALSSLSRSQREAIELAYYSGLSHTEIAAELGEPLGTIKSRIRDGLIRLRKSLRTVYGGEVAS